MTVNTPYLGTPSDSTTVLSDLSVSGEVYANTGSFAGTITVTDDQFLSVNSVADETGLTVGQLALVFAASGVSLVYSSGASWYDVGSALSGAQA